MKIIVAGATGRMGRTLIEAILRAEDTTLSGALEVPGNPQLGKDAGELAGLGPHGLKVVSDTAPLLRTADALIEFDARSHPAYRLLTEYFAFPDKFNFIDLPIGRVFATGGYDLDAIIATHLPQALAANLDLCFADIVRNSLTKAGETAEQVAAQLPYDDYKLDRFLVLNGFKSEKDMKPNQLVKVVND